MTAPNERQAIVLDVLRSDPARGFDGDELEALTGLKHIGASAHALVDRGLAVDFVGGVGPVRTFWQLAPTGRSAYREAADGPDGDAFAGLS